MRARHRLGKFLLRHGRRPPTGIRAWTQRHLTWVKSAVHFEQAAQEATLLDYVHEVDHVAGRIERLERAIDAAVQTAPERMREVIEALQALRGIALVSAVTIVASASSRALANLATDGLQRHRRERGFQWRAGPSWGDHQDWQRPPPAHRHRSGVGVSPPTRRGRRAAETTSRAHDEVKAIAWKAQHRLHARYRTLTARGKTKQHAVTAVGRELLGFIWAIGITVETKGRATHPVAA